MTIFANLDYSTNHHDHPEQQFRAWSFLTSEHHCLPDFFWSGLRTCFIFFSSLVLNILHDLWSFMYFHHFPVGVISSSWTDQLQVGRTLVRGEGSNMFLAIQKTQTAKAECRTHLLINARRKTIWNQQAIPANYSPPPKDNKQVQSKKNQCVINNKGSVPFAWRAKLPSFLRWGRAFRCPLGAMLGA